MGREAHCHPRCDVRRSGRAVSFGVSMKARLAVLLAVAATAFGGAAVAPATDVAALSPLAQAKPCSARYVHAALSWGHKCLAAGQYCKVTADREYHPYRFHCHASSRDSEGDYHLTRR